jgi:hypothetical protein
MIFTESIITTGGTTRDMKVSLVQHGALVELSDMGKYNKFSVHLPWDQLSDVEMLSEIFDMELVRTFKVIVETLAKIHHRKDTYKSLCNIDKPVQ